MGSRFSICLNKKRCYDFILLLFLGGLLGTTILLALAVCLSFLLLYSCISSTLHSSEQDNSFLAA